MLKIGDFSKLSRISIRMLRHYDEIGLLIPDHVDDFTGYRYYREAQLARAGRIQALKNLGFGLALIGEILEKYDDPQEMEQFLSIKQQEIREQEQLIREKGRLLDSTMKWLRKDGNMMGYDVSLKTIPQMKAAGVRSVIPTYADEGILWKILMEETGPLHVQWAVPCYAMAKYYEGEYKERDVDAEVSMSVVGDYADTEHVRFFTMPQVEIAGATFKGSYEQLTHVNAAVAKWIGDNGYEFNGLSFNIYHVGPKDTRNPEEYVTEVCYPVKKK